MLKDITLGQYFPGDTPIHNMDPRTKLIILILYIIALFTCAGFVGYGLMAVFLGACMVVSRISPRTALKGLRPLLVIIILTGILNMFYTKGTPVADVFLLRKITWEGLKAALFMILRIMLLVVGAFMLTYTTSPMDLTDGMEKLLEPLKKLGVPIHELAMMMSIALRFIPTLIEETDKIVSAQKARGASFDTGKLHERAKALLPILVPLFVSAFRRADELATAMECRCYHGGEGRTKLKIFRFEIRDYIAFAIGAAMLVASITLRRHGL